MTVLGQLCQLLAYGLQVGDVAVELAHVLVRQRLDIGAAAAMVAPQRQQRAYALERKAKVARTTDEAQRLHLALRELAVTRVLARRVGYQSMPS